ncbi:protein HAIKU1-like [Pistacia vera]|uniref:protein HAIKU1-like n=1 Tax=Pistacia vera TaxID=55513 RepID=UPI0012636D0A|nr:protein HAIKU1-like [Pistacia vera]
MDNSKNRHNNDHLGVNKMGKNIRKSPLHQPNFAANNNANRQQPQPQVYNISKNDFRNIVQQLTGSPSQDPLPRPPQNPPKPQSMRLQKIRPPPLTPINRPHIPPMVPAPAPAPMPAPLPPPFPYNNNLMRPHAPYGQAMSQYGQLQPMAPWDNSAWPNTAESPISAYMRDLQNVLGDHGHRGNQAPPHPHAQFHPPPQVQGQAHPQPPSSGLLPNPPMPGLPSPRVNGPGPVPLMPNLPSPRMNGPPLLPSPTSQFLLSSPTGYMNLFSPRSPYPLLSPGAQFPPPLTPNFAFSPMAQSGILGPGPQPPLSPGAFFPLSPSGFFPISSPRWRDQ